MVLSPDPEDAPSARYERLVASKEIVICVGSGGVGKTTTSAVVALHAALSGRRALVLTIDPAKRLANSLGVQGLGNSPQQIGLEQFGRDHGGGTLHAMMLDMKQSFDHLINTYAADSSAKHEIFKNKLYQYFSTSLAGTQEYAAAEKLFELYHQGDYDLIVLDTPPTSHALDFLEAPNRLIDAINSRAMQWLYSKPGGRGLFSVGTSYVVKTMSKFTGGQMIQELGVFLKAFSTLFGGFQERAGKVRELVTSEVTTFTVVTSPNAGNIDEALYFYRKLGDDQASVGAFVTNRVHPGWVPREELGTPSLRLLEELDQWSERALEGGEGAQRDFVRKMRQNATDFQVLADLDQVAIEALRDQVPETIPILQVPYFSHDIHSLAGLDHVRRALFGHTKVGDLSQK